MSKILVAVPWVGEFGYELFRWQGHIRHIAKDFDEVVVASRAGNEYLYQDFAKFIPYNTDTNICNGRINEDVKSDMLQVMQELFGHIPYYQALHPYDKFVDEQPAEYVKLGTPNLYKGYDIVLHARNINTNGLDVERQDVIDQKQQRNWSYEKWEDLAEFFHKQDYTMACIGSVRSSYLLPFCNNMRGIPLNELADLLASSSLIVGPSSGPMHLATLCGCPQLVWGEEFLIPRYKQIWNPFGTQVNYVVTDEQWDPQVGRIIDGFKQFIRS